MKPTSLTTVFAMLLAMTVGVATAQAKPKAELNKTGEKLAEKYEKQLEYLRAELSKSVPGASEAQKAAYKKALAAEEAAKAQLAEAQKQMGKVRTAKALIGHAKGKWIGGADKGIAQAKKALEQAKTPAEREKAQKELKKWQENREAGVAALKERQAKYDALKPRVPEFEKQIEEAQQALAAAKQDALDTVKSLDLDSVLTSAKMDGKLARFVVLSEATPRGLAAFAQQSPEHYKLVEQMLDNEELLIQMCVADGPAKNNWGQAFKVYSDIQNASDNADDGVLQRLAVAAALEFAVPNKRRNPKTDTDAPQYVDPVERYMHYEQAFLAGELDPYFPTHDTWTLRFVLESQGYTNEVLTWGREMLRTYRPDHITTDSDAWRYAAAVRTEIRYGSQENKYDKDELHFFQNILMNGGVCGRRAFFGRFVLRAFGVPSTARPSPGHAALARWTPDGWVVLLGGGWGAGTTKTQYKDDKDFLATTQARAAGEDAFMRVKRAQWIGDVEGERPVYGLNDRNEPGFWYGVSLYKQRQIIEESNAKTLAAVGEELGEANESEVKYPFKTAQITEADREIRVDNDGVITIPAAATSEPTKGSRKIIFMDSNLGGKQLHYSRTGGHQDFEYTFNAPSAGKYALTIKVASSSWKQHLHLHVNGKEPINIELPHTVGLWDVTEPVMVELKKGENVLRFSRKNVDNPVQMKGFTIKEYKLAPADKRMTQLGSN